MDWRKQSWVWAAMALFAALLWQYTIAESRFSGNWTGLFHSGDSWKLPPELSGSTFQHPASLGYDGQFYRLCAHDPFDQKRYSEFMDSASYRRKRALIPLLAWGLGLGQSRWIDFTYFLVLNGFVFLGAWMLAELARGWSRHPAWGLAFLIFPATLNGIDRMLPDLPLGAALIGFILYRKQRMAIAWCCLAAALLTRELGLLIVAAAVGQSLWERRWRIAALWATSILPAMLWWEACNRLFSAGSKPPTLHWLARTPVYGFFIRLGDPISYDTYPWLRPVFQAADAAVMLALPAAAGMAVWLWWKNRKGDLEWQSLAAAGLIVVASHPYFLRDDFSYPRTYSLLVGPFLLLALRTGQWWWAVPCALLAFRLMLGFAMELGPLMRAVTSALRA